MAEGKIGFFGYRNRTETRQNWVGHFGCPFLSRARIVFLPSAHAGASHHPPKFLMCVWENLKWKAAHSSGCKSDLRRSTRKKRKAWHNTAKRWRPEGSKLHEMKTNGNFFMIPHAARLSHTCFYCSRCSQAFQNVETINKLRGGIQFHVYLLKHNGSRRWVSEKGSPKRIFNDAIPGLRVCRLPPIKRCFITYQNKSKLVTCNCISATHNNSPRQPQSSAKNQSHFHK